MTDPRNRYVRRLAAGVLVLAAVLMAASTALPGKFAGDLRDRKVGLLLNGWEQEIARIRSHAAQQSYAGFEEDIERRSFQVNGHRTDVSFQILRSEHHPSQDELRQFIDSFNPDDYLVEGRLGRRSMVGFLYSSEDWRLCILKPEPDADVYRAVIGPSLVEEVQRLVGDEWILQVVFGNSVWFSSDPALPSGRELADEDLLGRIERLRQVEAVDISRPREFEGRLCALAPLKDFDQWDVEGAYLLTERHGSAGSAAQLAVVAVMLALAVLGHAATAWRASIRYSSKEPAGIWMDTAFAALGSLLLAVALILLGNGAARATTELSQDAFVWLVGAADRAAVESASFPMSIESLAMLALQLGALAITFLLVFSLARSRHLTSLREVVAAAGFLTPAVLYLAIFVAGPILFALFLSFHEWGIVDPIKSFVGFGNYAELLGDALFWRSLFNTLVFSLHVPLAMAGALALALLLQHRFRGVALLRTLFFLPYVTSFVAVSTVWQWLYNTDFGLINYLLSFVGLGPVAWLSEPSTAMLAVMIMSIWIQLGYMMVVFIAGLQAIEPQLREAAMLDGAGPWARFRCITLPLLRPTVFFILATSIINSFQVFTYVYVMTAGGPLHSTEVLVYHIYKNAWEYFRMGYASALSWVLFALIMVVTLAQFAYFSKRIEQVTA